MVPVVPALVVFTAQASAPRYFTNAENVRRIATGKSFVAFATSGGVRVFERASQKWRVYTQNDGLPTHNIHDVVFDKAKPDTLWVLCGSWGDWANEQPEPDLRIVTLDLASGKVESVAPPIAAPRTARMGYQFFLDYRLSVSDGWAFVFTDKGAALAWDRAAKAWRRQVTVEPTPPRASAYPGHVSSLQLVGSSGSTLAFFIQTKLRYINQSQVVPGANGQPPTVVNTMIPMGDELPPHILLYDRQTGRGTRHPIGQGLMGQTTVQPAVAGRPSTILMGGRPARLVPDTRPGTFLIESLASEFTPNSPGEGYTATHTLVRHRVAPNLKEPVLIGSEKITNQQATPIQQAMRNSTPFWTDFVLDGNTLWVANYNDPNYPQSAGIARLDLATGKWERFKPSVTGIAANFASITKTKQGIFSMSRSVLPKRYDPKLDDFTAPQNLSETDFFDSPILPDPRAMPKNEEEQSFWASLRTLGRSGNQLLVFGPAEASRRFERQGNEFKSFPIKYDTLFFYDIPTKKLTKLEMRGLEGLVPKSAGFTESTLFFLTEEKAPDERRGAPVVIRWDSNTGAVKRYPESLFREVSVAAQRAAGLRQQVDLKQRQTQRNEQLKRFPQVAIPPVVLRPPMEFLLPLRGSFLTATGTTWLRLDQHLFRYDASRDTWTAEGLADSLSPEGETALWKQTGPESWRFEGFEARRLRGEVARWSAETGWQKLLLGESGRAAGNSVLYHDDTLWLTGVGVLRLPRSTWTFQKAP
ncbi:hypothetical protein [Armatimonas rosea]|uniref:Uncharacterized protein n=1 Tax=Armatimonas rosea TaxID=685828 RepID=A0A7W9SKX5_ARMRO|nr:hypothetical protein [Armatimonas rosea]MBB6048516.1 hypothetical protein [Armatimonas rosea]